MGYYSIPLLLQLYCFYHAYSNKKEFYWYAVIFFIPILGGIIYLFLNVFNKNDAQIIGEEINTVINPSKKMRDLTNKVEFADTFQNRVALADAHFNKAEYQNAVLHYEKVLEGAHKNDIYVQEQLVNTHYLLGNYEKVVKIAKPLKSNSTSSASKTKYFLGLSYKELGKFNNAEKNLRALDLRYSNYTERHVLAQFLLERKKNDDAKELLEELLIEYNHMSKPNRKQNRLTFIEIKKSHNSLA